ncbi:hypothetical protein F5Y10DRAFT_257647 [Nemania abortiva]|nr:hypothetical protein F5Y10DRAFT_257647 [Nemania abortiva]
MRPSFYQRRRMPRFPIFARAEGVAEVDVPAPIDDESSADELESDDEFSDDEFSDEELSDDEDSPPTSSTLPSTSSGLEATTTFISSQSTTVAAPTATVSATTSAANLATTSSTLTPSQTIPLMSKSTLLPPASTSSFSPATTPTVPTSAVPVLDPGDLTTSTSILPQSTSNAQLGTSTDASPPANFINPTGESRDSTSNNSQRAGQIAGGVVGGIVFVGLILFAVWMWRRRRRIRDNRLSRMSEMPPDDTRYLASQPRGPGNYRSPSSIMNQLMTAAYAAEDGRSYRDSDRIFDTYSSEKQAFTTHENESTERLTIPAAAQLRPPSIAARTETTNRTESTWKTWGVLAGSSRLPAPRNWWVDRYFRT